MEKKSPMLKQVVDSLEMILVMFKDVPDNERPPIVDIMSGYFDKAYQASIGEEPLAWMNFGISPELFWAMDIVPLVIDAIAGQTATMSPDALQRYVDSAHEYMPDYICANNKVILGAAFAGDIPPPDILVHPSSPCDSNLATYPIVAEYFGFPYFCVDMPYAINGEINESGIEYMTNEMKKLVSALEDATGKKLEYEKLKFAIECSNKSHEYILKIAELRSAVPCPYSSMDTLAETGLAMCLMGTPQVVDYFKQRYADTKARVDKGEGYFTKEKEKIRLAWIYGAPVFDYGIYEWLENEFGCVSVSMMNNNLVMKPVEDISSTDNILRGLAKKITQLPMVRECGGTFDRYTDAAIDMCRRYKADAAVFGGHVACKANWAVAKMAQDKIHDELGIPTLNLELDLFDPRVTSGDAVRTSFEKFFEINF